MLMTGSATLMERSTVFVHAAGVSGGGIIALKTEFGGRVAVMAPKVTRHTEAGPASYRARRLALCCYVSFPRIDSWRNADKFDYCAANYFLDAVATITRARSARTRFFNWGALAGIGHGG